MRLGLLTFPTLVGEVELGNGYGEVKICRGSPKGLGRFGSVAMAVSSCCQVIISGLLMYRNKQVASFHQAFKIMYSMTPNCN